MNKKLLEIDTKVYHGIFGPSEGLEKAYELGRQEGVEVWISVDERLPAIGELVLFTVFGRNLVEMGCYRRDDDNWQSVETAPCDELIFFDAEQVTHWRPLPTPPSREKE